MGINDLEPKEFRAALTSAVEIITELYTDIEDKQVYRSKSRTEIFQLFDAVLPTGASDLESLLSEVKEKVIGNATIHYSQHFYAWVTSNATQASIIGDMISSALNINATTWLNSSAASEIEQQVISWVSQFIDYDNRANGVLLSGGSMANFTALRTAIAQKCPYDFENQGVDRTRPLRFYVSEQNHFCIDKALISLGIGQQNLRKIAIKKDFTIDCNELEKQLISDLEEGCIPISVIGNAGTVNTGAVDDIEALAKICKRYGLWLHLDAAYGGFAASTGLRQSKFMGLELADSIAVDLHKWLFVPFECGALLMKNPNHLKQTFSIVPEYQQFDHEETKVDFSELSMQQSRNFKALKVWMNFKTYGADNLRASIAKSIGIIDYLGELIEASPDFELISSPSLSVVCFRYLSEDQNLNNKILNRLNKSIIRDAEADGRVFIRETVLDGIVVLRACCTNFRRKRKHVEYLVRVLREIGMRNI